MTTDADPNPGQPDPADPEQLEPISPREIAALTAARILDTAPDDVPDDVPVSGWRVPGLGQTPASAVAAFQGLTPPLAALLLTRYSQPEQLVLDLTADLAVEGVAGAGGRRYTAVHPATAEILACTRQHGTWPPAALLLIRWPPQHATEPGWAPDLPELLRACRDLLAPDGHLIAAIGLHHADPPARAHDVIEAAARARLHLDHRHVILTARAPTRADQTPTPPSSPTRHIDLLAFTRGDGDD